MNDAAQNVDCYEIDCTEDSIDLEYRHGFISVDEVTNERHIWTDAGGFGGDWSDFVM